MIKVVCALFDVKSGVYDAPFVCLSEGDGLRRVVGSLDDAKSMLRRWPKDFRVYVVASFDDRTGVFSECQPRLLVEVSALVEQIESEAAAAAARRDERYPRGDVR